MEDADEGLFYMIHGDITYVDEALYANKLSVVFEDLAAARETIPAGEITFKTRTGKYVCSVCGYVYDPAEHDGVAFEDLPEDWKRPRCKRPKSAFNAA